MVLIVGGKGTGKRRWVLNSLHYAPEDIAMEVNENKPVLYGLEAILRNEDGDGLLSNLLAREVVICDEVGCGVVPMTAEERMWRDEVGRICCLLAEQAEVVVRLCCGLPLALKGRLEDCR